MNAPMTTNSNAGTLNCELPPGTKLTSTGVDVAVAVAGIGVLVGVAVATTGVFVGVLVGVAVAVIGVFVGVLVGVAVAVIGVLVGVLVGVDVGMTGVFVGVLVGVDVGMTGVLVGVAVGVCCANAGTPTMETATNKVADTVNRLRCPAITAVISTPKAKIHQPASPTATSRMRSTQVRSCPDISPYYQMPARV